MTNFFLKNKLFFHFLTLFFHFLKLSFTFFNFLCVFIVEEMPLETKKSMLKYGLRIINTKDEKVREWFKSEDSECWGFIRLLDEIWDIKDPDVEEVRNRVKEFFGSELEGATKEEETEIVISIIRYLQSAGGLKKEVWKEAEKLLRKDNTTN